MIALFVESESLLAPQHGFVPGRSCTSQLILAIEEWSRNLDAGTPVDAIYLDFKKTFDAVANERLLITLSGLGIRGKLLNWIRSFLSGRKQRVVLDGSQSKWVDVTSGVPQASVLRPTLFIAAVHSLRSWDV